MKLSEDVCLTQIFENLMRNPSTIFFYIIGELFVNKTVIPSALRNG